MRISAKIMADNIKANLAKQSTQLMNTETELSTGKRINKPSDDPTGMGKVLDYRTTQQAITQYRANITDAKTRIQYTEGVLGQINDLVDQAKKIASDTQSGDGTSLAQQVDDIRKQILGLTNSKYENEYIFSGNRSDTPPFDSTSPYTYNGDTGSHQVIVGQGVGVQIQTDGSQMFVDGSDNLFQVLDNLKTALSTDPVDSSAVQSAVDPLDRISNRLQQSQSDMATTYQSLESTDNHWNDFSNAVENMRQKVEDADPTQTAIDMQVQQTSYQLLLQTAAKVIQPSLVNFLS
jgi:flagellar hook-associated protein 3 FlgL